MTGLFDLKVRLSFPGLIRSIDETGPLTARWAESAARILAPDLEWVAEVAARETREGDERWGAEHVVKLVGHHPSGEILGRGEARVVAGGDARRVGGNGLVEIEAVQPVRYLAADNHCNVEHWDLAAAPLTEAQIDRLRRALEEVLGVPASIGGERREDFVRGGHALTDAATSEDAAVWMEDLDSIGIACRGHAAGDAIAIFADHAEIDDLEELDEARVVLGEVLSELGHEDWLERARAILLRLPQR